MTNKQFAQSYFDQARSILKELELHYQDAQWHLVVRRAQEIVELILKGFLRLSGIEIPRLHDVGPIFREQKDRFPNSVTKELPRIISISRRLRQEREVSFYGDEEQELPPNQLYTQVDADGAKQDVEWLMKLMPKGS